MQLLCHYSTLLSAAPFKDHHSGLHLISTQYCWLICRSVSLNVPSYTLNTKVILNILENNTCTNVHDVIYEGICTAVILHISTTCDYSTSMFYYSQHVKVNSRLKHRHLGPLDDIISLEHQAFVCLPLQIWTSPTTMMSTSAKSFPTVKTSWILVAQRTLEQFTQVRNTV